jgi:6-phosphogluconolactonase
MMHIFSSTDELNQVLAQFIVNTAREAVKANGRFTLALTGGSSPKKLYQLLTQPPYKEELFWKDTYVFWGDERFVPEDDDRYNAKMAYETLLNYVPVPRDQIYPIPYSTVTPPEEIARQYENLLKNHFNMAAPQFDLILLGMGDDGHTASLFPHTQVLQESERWVSEVYHTGQQMYRITLTAPLINQAKKIAFLLFGENKTQVLHEVLEGQYQPQHLPTQLIKPISGEIHWFIDESAAGKLSRNSRKK